MGAPAADVVFPKLALHWRFGRVLWARELQDGLSRTVHLLRIGDLTAKTVVQMMNVEGLCESHLATPLRKCRSSLEGDADVPLAVSGRVGRMRSQSPCRVLERQTLVFMRRRSTPRAFASGQMATLAAPIRTATALWWTRYARAEARPLRVRCAGRRVATDFRRTQYRCGAALKRRRRCRIETSDGRWQCAMSLCGRSIQSESRRTAPEGGLHACPRTRSYWPSGYRCAPTRSSPRPDAWRTARLTGVLIAAGDRGQPFSRRDNCTKRIPRGTEASCSWRAGCGLYGGLVPVTERERIVHSRKRLFTEVGFSLEKSTKLWGTNRYGKTAALAPETGASVGRRYLNMYCDYK